MPKTQSNADGTQSGSTDHLLRVIIALLVRQKAGETASLKRQIEILDDLGMRPVEIAETLGKKPKHVSKELAGIRKNRNRED